MALPKWPRHTEWSREKKTIESSETEEEGEKTNCFRVVDQSTIIGGRGRRGREKKGHPLNPLPLCPFVHFAVWAEFIRILATRRKELSFGQTDRRK